MENLSISTCRLHGNSKPSSTTVSPHHRVQNIDLMDDIPLPFQTSNSTENNHQNSPIISKSTTPIFDGTGTLTPRRLNSSCQYNNIITTAEQAAAATTTTTTPIHNEILTTSANVINNLNATTSHQITSCKLRHRWHACPELKKAMDGVMYIADHTKKEEESTRVSWFFVSFMINFYYLFDKFIQIVCGAV